MWHGFPTPSRCSLQRSRSCSPSTVCVLAGRAPARHYPDKREAPRHDSLLSNFSTEPPRLSLENFKARALSSCTADTFKPSVTSTVVHFVMPSTIASCVRNLQQLITTHLLHTRASSLGRESSPERGGKEKRRKTSVIRSRGACWPAQGTSHLRSRASKGNRRRHKALLFAPPSSSRQRFARPFVEVHRFCLWPVISRPLTWIPITDMSSAARLAQASEY